MKNLLKLNYEKFGYSENSTKIYFDQNYGKLNLNIQLDKLDFKQELNKVIFSHILAKIVFGGQSMKDKVPIRFTKISFSRNSKNIDFKQMKIKICFR